MQSSTGSAWTSMMRMSWGTSSRTRRTSSTTTAGWDLLKAEDVFKRTSFAPTLTPVPTLTPLPTNNSLMPEDCADPSIATYDELEAGFPTARCTVPSL